MEDNTLHIPHNNKTHIKTPIPDVWHHVTMSCSFKEFCSALSVRYYRDSVHDRFLVRLESACLATSVVKASFTASVNILLGTLLWFLWGHMCKHCLWLPFVPK